LANIGAPGNGQGSIRRGKVDDKVVQLDRAGDKFVLKIYDYDGYNSGLSLILEHDNQAMLEKYFEVMYGHIVWESAMAG
jgi:hypothetical protein